MRILVLSDSHSSLSFMRKCMDAVHPDRVIHLGDYVADADALAEEYPDIPFHRVAGNCDRCRVPEDYPEIVVEQFAGVKVLFTHGHRHNVKIYTEKLIDDGKRCGAGIVLYGHTHCDDCRCLDDGMWVMNPGSCGYYGGSAGLIEISSAQNFTCRIIRYQDLEGIL